MHYEENNEKVLILIHKGKAKIKLNTVINEKVKEKKPKGILCIKKSPISARCYLDR